MALVVLASNILVQYPFAHLGLGDYLTWGAFTYPFSFLDHRSVEPPFRVGRRAAGRLCGFRARGRALGRLRDAAHRHRVRGGLPRRPAPRHPHLRASLRDRAWWLPPFVSSVISSALDTAIFFSLAFYCGPVPGLGMTISDLLGAVGIADACVALPWTNLAVGRLRRQARCSQPFPSRPTGRS